MLEKKKLKRFLILMAMIALLLPAVLVKAAMPTVVNYQGRLSDVANSPLSGQYDFRFRLYDDAAKTTLLWGPEEHLNETVNNGYFSVQLGSIDSFAAAGLDFTDQYWLTLEIKENAAGVWDTETDPPVAFSSYAYALNAEKIESTTGFVSVGGSIQGGAALVGAENALSVDTGAGFTGNLFTLSNNGNTYLTIDDVGDAAFTGTSHITMENNAVNDLIGLKIIQTNDVDNYSGALVELKGSGADYTNNMYFGKYGDGFWVPSWAGNGVVATDQNLVIAAVDNSSEINFQIGGGYTAPNDILYIASNGAEYAADYSALNAANDRWIPDKAYVDSVGAVTMQGAADNSIAADGYVLYDTGAVIYEDDGGAAKIEAEVGGYEFAMTEASTNTSLYVRSESSVGADDAEFRFIDNRTTTVGLEYAGDYSADFTDRTLVDKAYVDSLSTSIWDADADTGIDVEETADDDIVRIYSGGYEALDISRTHLTTNNSSHSVYLGEGIAPADDLTSNYNVAIGYEAGNALNTGFDNVMLGYRPGYNTTSGSNNAFIGYNAGFSNTTGRENVFIGYEAGYSATTQLRQVAIGYHAGRNNTGGYGNTMLGYIAGRDNTGNDNLFLGYESGVSNTGSDNFFMGRGTGRENTGNQNVLLGYFSGYSNEGSYNLIMGPNGGTNNIGDYNIFLGDNVGFNNEGDNNIFMGRQSGRNNTTGSNNLFLGDYSGFTNTTGTGNIFIGSNAAYNETGSNLLYIENSNTSNPLVYGDFSSDFLRVNGTLQVNNPSATGYAFPIADGTSGQVLRTDGSGALSWVTVSGAGSSMWDADGDTGMQLEETVDDDTFRVDTAGQERFTIDASGDLHWMDGGYQNAYFNIDNPSNLAGSDPSMAGIALDSSGDKTWLMGNNVHVPANLTVGSTSTPHAMVDIGEGQITSPAGDTSILLNQDGGDVFLETASTDMAEGLIMHGYSSGTYDYGVVRNVASSGYASGWNSGLHIFTNDNGSSSSDPIIFSTDGNEVMRLDDNGYIGIGNNLPSERLDISDGSVRILNDQIDPQIILEGQDMGRRWVLGQDESDQIGSTGFYIAEGAGVDATDALFYLQPDGFLGLGTYSPNSKLDIYAGDLRLSNTTGSGCFRYNNTSNQLEYSNDCSTYNSFSSPSGGGWTDDGAVVRLTTASDFVGIGNSNPKAQLDVGEGSLSNPDGDVSIIVSQDGGDSFFETRSTDMSEGLIMQGPDSIGEDSGIVRQLYGMQYTSGWTKGLHIFNENTDPIMFDVNGSELVTIRNSGGYAFEVKDTDGNRIIAPGITYNSNTSGAENQNIGIGDVDAADNGTWLGIDTGNGAFGFNNGDIYLENNGSSVGTLNFLELSGNGSQFVAFEAPDSIATNVVWTLPAADGTSGQVLSTDGLGNLSWVSASGISVANGIYDDAGTIKLGGDLTETTYINHQGYDLIVREFAGEPETRFAGDNFKIINSPINRQVQFGISGVDTSGISLEGDYSQELFYRDNSIYVTSDALAFQGLVYAADYSANYTNRSLVDKEYVDGLINLWTTGTTGLDTYLKPVTYNEIAFGDGSDRGRLYGDSGSVTLDSDVTTISATSGVVIDSGQFNVNSQLRIDSAGSGFDVRLASANLTATRLFEFPDYAGDLVVTDNSAALNGYVLSWNGSEWAPTAPSGGSGSGDAIWDTDTDTGIQVEESADEDTIRFDTAGVEYFTMKRGKLSVLNTGQSVFIGEGAGAADDLTNNQNVFIGYNSGTANNSLGNAVLGYNSLSASTSGNYNSAMGANVMSLYTGSWNTAMGAFSLDAAGSGSENVAIGGYSLTDNTFGAYNTAVGFRSLQDNVSGSSNSSFGHQSMYYNTIGTYNSAFGVNALTGNTSGSYNVAIGSSALYTNVDGVNNAAIGSDAMILNSSGDYNVALGYRALRTNASGSYNAAVGNQALYSNVGNQNTAVGADAFYDGTGTANTVVGYNTARGISNGSYNTIIGANVTGLTWNTSNNIIIADGQGNRRINVDENGLVGIGLDDPGLKLHVVSDSAAVAAFDRTTDDGTLISLRQDGVEEGTITVSGNTVSYNGFTGSHYVWTDEGITRGMLVELTGSNKYLHNNTESEILYGVKPVREVNSPRVLGSYLAKLEPSKEQSLSNPSLVMAEGNGNLWVVDTGEDIQAGDYLISSDVEGHAQLLDSDFAVNYVVARAAENVAWDDVDKTFAGHKHKMVSVFFDTLVINTETVQYIVDNEEQGSTLMADEIGDTSSKNNKKETADSEMGQARLSSGKTQMHINFKNGFESAPLVMLTLANDSSLTRYYVTNVNKNGFNLHIYPSQRKDTIINWQAIYSDYQLIEDGDTEIIPVDNVNISNDSSDVEEIQKDDEDKENNEDDKKDDNDKENKKEKSDGDDYTIIDAINDLEAEFGEIGSGVINNSNENILIIDIDDNGAEAELTEEAEDLGHSDSIEEEDGLNEESSEENIILEEDSSEDANLEVKSDFIEEEIEKELEDMPEETEDSSLSHYFLKNILALKIN